MTTIVERLDGAPSGKRPPAKRLAQSRNRRNGHMGERCPTSFLGATRPLRRPV
jgi:hypothetical protein